VTTPGDVAGDRADPTLPSAAKRALRAAAGLIAGIAAMLVAGRWLGIHPAEVARALRVVSPSMVGGCLASAFVVFGLQALRWHSVMRPVTGLRYAEAYRALVVGTMFNALLPARGGDLLRVQYLGRRTGKSRAKILGTEIVDRWLDWWGWIPVLLALAITGEVPRWIFTVLAAFGGLLALAAVGLVLLLRLGRGLQPGSRFGSAYRSFRDGARAFVSYRSLLIAWTIAPLPWLWESVVLRWAARAFDIHLTVAQAFSVLVGLNLGMFIPSPGAIGSMETAGTAALVLCGAARPAALAFMFVYHLTQLAPGLAAGVAVLVAEGEFLFGRPAPGRSRRRSRGGAAEASVPDTAPALATSRAQDREP
jgi:glycosyltransferase 2 family protein